uniref:Uncharacterized protein n=1 Tax=Eptatretus burgeri TaxID=7764 RepID=A0A8C4WWW0_EPTBU
MDSDLANQLKFYKRSGIALAQSCPEMSRRLLFMYRQRASDAALDSSECSNKYLSSFCSNCFSLLHPCRVRLRLKPKARSTSTNLKLARRFQRGQQMCLWLLRKNKRHLRTPGKVLLTCFVCGKTDNFHTLSREGVWARRSPPTAETSQDSNANTPHAAVTRVPSARLTPRTPLSSRDTYSPFVTRQTTLPGVSKWKNMKTPTSNGSRPLLGRSFHKKPFSMLKRLMTEEKHISGNLF